MPGESSYSVAVDATLRRAAFRQAGEGQNGPRKLCLTVADLCKKLRVRPCEHLVVFVVDTSDSMGGQRRQRMQVAKGAVIALLRHAYQGRHRVALVAFGGEEARVVLPPTHSVNLAVERLREMPSGGATPMADGLQKALQIVQTERLKHPGIRPVLVVISDGEANVPLVSGVPPLRELLALAERIHRAKITSVFLDAAMETGKSSSMPPIAARMGAAYRALGELRPRQILECLSDRFNAS